MGSPPMKSDSCKTEIHSPLQKGNGSSRSVSPHGNYSWIYNARRRHSRRRHSGNVLSTLPSVDGSARARQITVLRLDAPGGVDSREGAGEIRVVKIVPSAPAILPARRATGEGRIAVDAWREVTSKDARNAIRGTSIEMLVREFESVTSPPLPLEATLPKALALAGCALSQRNGKITDEFALGQALAKVRIMTAGGQVANFYTLVVANSGSGKDIGNRLSCHATRHHWSIGTGGTAEGLADKLILTPNGLLVISEFQNYLDPQRWEGQASPFLTAAFSQGYFEISHSARTKAAPRKTRYCYPNISANIQPSVFKRYCTEERVSSGFLPRFLVTTMPDHCNECRPACGNEAYLDALYRDSCVALDQYMILEGPVQVEQGYLGDTYRMFTEGNAPYPPVYMRLVNEYGPRLALVLSVTPGSKSTTPVITQDGWRRASVLVMWHYKQFVDLLDDTEGDGRLSRLNNVADRVLTIIRNAGSGGVEKATISRNCGRSSSAPERTRAIAELLDRGLIEVKPESGGDAGAARYIAVDG